jgi:hypothetical protein
MKMLVALFALSFAACAAEDAAPSSVEPPEDTVEMQPPDPVPVPDQLRMADPSSPGVSATIADDCTYIQWCNKPNSPERIVCINKNTGLCQQLCTTQQGRDSVVSACQNTAVDVCGTSFDITYHGCNGLGPP